MGRLSPRTPQRVCVGDSPLMDILVSSKLYTTSELGDLQRVRCFKCVHFLSDVLCSDGCTVCPDMLTNLTVPSSRTFSLERPTKNDFDLWRHALRQISSSQYTLENGLGDYLIPPHNHDGWFCSPDKSTLYHESESGDISVYELPRGSRTSQRPQYFCSDILPTSFDKPACDLATVLNSTRGNVVTLHSTAAQPSTPITQTPTVQELLQSTDNDGRWDSFKCSGDGWWIRDALLNRTLVMVSDGSYMASRHIGACSGAFVLKCICTKKKATCTWAEV